MIHPDSKSHVFESPYPPLLHSSATKQATVFPLLKSVITHQLIIPEERAATADSVSSLKQTRQLPLLQTHIPIQTPLFPLNCTQHSSGKKDLSSHPLFSPLPFPNPTNPPLTPSLTHSPVPIVQILRIQAHP